MRNTKFCTSSMITRLFIFACCLSISGCRQSAELPTVTHGSMGWKPADEEPSVPGIDQAMIRWCYFEQRLTYVVWTDLLGGGGTGFAGGSTLTSHSRKDYGELRSADSRRLIYEYDLDLDEAVSVKPDEMGVVDMGGITIDGVRYDLKDGPFLLVSTRAKNVRVQQLALTSEVQALLHSSDEEDPLRTALRLFAEKNPDIRDFFEKAAKAEGP